MTENTRTKCAVCPRRCNIPEGDRGFCLGRGNVGGEIVSLSYGVITSEALDPIEKKPLMHFHPGSFIYSIGSYGCTLECAFCQNHEIAREVYNLKKTPPEQIVENAIALIPHGNIGVAYTYNEPLASYEFVRDTSALVRKAGMKNVLVSNGFLLDDPFKEAIANIDAANIDLKAFEDEFYQKTCKAPKGAINQIMSNIETAFRQGVHVEITLLVIPGLNDNPDIAENMFKWIASVSRDIPIHITRFFPRFHMLDKAPTPIESLLEIQARASKHLRHVHLGNVH
jgi:pyruvate formate lyase activating enzyme